MENLESDISQNTENDPQNFRRTALNATAVIAALIVSSCSNGNGLPSDDPRISDPEVAPTTTEVEIAPNEGLNHL